MTTQPAPIEIGYDGSPGVLHHTQCPIAIVD